MSVEALLGTDAVFAADLQALRPHPGQAVSAANLRALLAGSRDRGQPPRPGTAPACRTPTRCAARRRCTAPPATRSLTPALVRRARARVAPSTTPSSRSTAGSSPTATSTARRWRYVLDFLAIAVADVASIAERRTDRFLDRARNHGLPPFLAARPGRRLRPHDRAVHPGRDRLGAQAPGRAGVRRLDPVRRPCRRTTSRWAGRPPASCAARVDGLTRVLAIELLTAARALDLRAPLAPAPATAAARDAAARAGRRARPGPLPLARDRSRRRARPVRALVAAAEAVCGPLH